MVVFLRALCVLLFLHGPHGFGQEVEKIIDRDHPIYGRSSTLVAPFREDPAGNFYAVQTGENKGIVRIFPDGFAQIVLSTRLPLHQPTVTVLNPNPNERTDNYDGVNTSVPLNGISHFDIDDEGNLYVAGQYSNNVVRVATDGTVTELINSNGDGLGHTLLAPSLVSINSQGELLVVGGESNNVLKVDVHGEITQMLDASGVDGKSFSGAIQMTKDKYGNRYIAANDAVFKIGISGVSTALLTLESMPASLSISSLYPSNLAIDDLGNLYFSLQNTISSLYRLNADGGVELLLDETGDGTGKVVCVSSADASEVDPSWPCSHNGNPLHSIANVTVDAAQNVFVVGQVSRNVFKLTPSGTVSEVADLSQDTRFDKHWFVASSIDSSGRLYFTATNQIDNATGALFRYSPLPIEKQEAFTIDPPHAAVIHDESGLAHFPTEYARTDYQHTGDVPAIANTLNTRSLPFADLPWDEAQRSTESVSSVDTVVETEISTLQVEGHTVRREELSDAEVPLGERYVRRLTYFVDGVETLKLFNLYFPRSEYLAPSGEALSRWVFRNNDIITGGAQNDTLYGYDGHDILYGGAGDDVLSGGSGGNIYYGGDGVDTVNFEHRYSDYMLSKNPITNVVSVRGRTGLHNPFVDHIGADVEQIAFQDMLVNVDNIRYWGEVLPTELVALDDRNVTPVYRFYNSQSNAFFYTDNRDERTAVLRNSGPDNGLDLDWPFVYQGAKFQTAHSYPGAVPLYRFFNTKTGHHFFTINEQERDNIIDKIANAGWTYVFEGIAFEVYANNPAPDAPEKIRPVYRFYSHNLNRHVFTTSDTEAQLFDASNDWTSEGVGFYAEGLN